MRKILPLRVFVRRQQGTNKRTDFLCWNEKGSAAYATPRPAGRCWLPTAADAAPFTKGPGRTTVPRRRNTTLEGRGSTNEH
jgi:hypothetical protein